MILVTGANGLIGSAVVRQLTQAGESVRALRRPGSDLSNLADLHHQIEWAEGDILDVASLDEALLGIEYVIHTAAVVSFVPRDRPTMYKTNVEGTANVVNACLRAGISKLAYVSSVAALGRPSTAAPTAGRVIRIEEDQKWEESPLNSHYAKSKYLAELEVWRGAAEGLRVVVVNPSVVIGEGDWNRSSIQLFRYVWQEKPFYPPGTLNYVDVQDVAAMLCQLLTSGVSNERFVLSAGQVSYRDFLWKIADLFHKKRPKWAVSALVSALAWRVEAIRSWLTGHAPLVTKETALASRFHFYYPGERVTQVTGIEYTEIENTLQRVCTFFENKAKQALHP
jgi:nucleoside-diphosphate-sugar epimerase